MGSHVRTGYQPPDDSELFSLPPGPEPLTLKPAETAVIVVDMQNAYATEGGYVDIAGFDVSGAAAAVAQTKKVLDAARAAGITVIFFQNGWDKDYLEAGGPGSPNWHKSNAMKTMRARPELAGTLLAKGTWITRSWTVLRRNPAIFLSRKAVTAASSIPMSIAFCVRAASAPWSSSASQPMSVLN